MTSRFFVAVTIAAIVSGCHLVPSDPTPAQAASADHGPRVDQRDAEAQAERALLAVLRDPESARFAWAPVERGWSHADGGGHLFGWKLRGTVNSRNGLGGYSGPLRTWFLFQGGEVVDAWVEGAR